MCGIIGIVSGKNVAPQILEGLKRLEYRGYDSSGIATVHQGAINRIRAEGKLVNLESSLRQTELPGHIGIGHTRWATHGAPTEVNAHPHATKKVAVVHNGIIENYKPLKEELEKAGYHFQSQTDTEVACILITYYLDQKLSPQEAVAKTLKRLEGAFALGIIFADNPGLLIAARRGSPLAIGYEKGAMYLGSDAIALAPYTSQITYLEDGDWVELTQQGAVVHDETDKVVEREIKVTAVSGSAVEKGNYRHYMQKEIYEQPSVIGETLSVFYHPGTDAITLPKLPFDLKKISRITLVACGTSYYAGLVARYWLEQIAGLPVDIDIASEFRYRAPIMPKDGLAIFISQSGETADTLAALRYAKSKGQHCLGIVNVPESTMANEADAVLQTYAGPEIGVASTKAFTTQLTVLACFTLALAQARQSLPPDRLRHLAHALAEVPARASDVLHREEQIAALAANLSRASDVLYMGRGTAYAIALEGALKLKEISYIHAEGYAAGEMKHGPIALIDEHMPIIMIAPSDELFDKTASNMQEAVARGGKVILISDEAGIDAMGEHAVAAIRLPAVDPFVAPLLYALPVQLLAYHVAVYKGTDVDQPRNLAKSVTVE